MSRQLRHESAGLLLKVNELHFTGDAFWNSDNEDNGSSRSRIRSRFDVAIDDFEAFVSLAEAKTLATASLCIHYPRVNRDKLIVERLLRLTQDKGDFALRVVDDVWEAELVGHSARQAKRFVDRARELKECLTRHTFAKYARNWRVFPGAIDNEDLHTLRTRLIAEDLQFALDCIRNGI